MRHPLAALIIAALACLAAPVATAQKNIDKLQKEKQTINREIRDTNKKLKNNNREAARQLNRLDALRSDMKKQNAIITSTRRSADSIAGAINRLNDTIQSLEDQLVKLQKGYSRSLRRLQGTTTPLSEWAFVLSSSDFTEAWRRVRYLRRFSAWRKKKAEDIDATRSSLVAHRRKLDTLALQRGHALERLDLASRKLARQQQETQNVVASLKKEESGLRAFLKQKQERSRQLDRQIDKLIAQEQARQEAERKKKAEAEKKRRLEQEKAAAAASSAKSSAPAASPGKSSAENAPKPKPQESYADPDRQLTGSFESNKGRLLFPVAGKYRIVRPFGRQQHPELEHVETENSGIDIAVAKGTQARAVFEGKVSAIFQQPGFNTIVMLRHGSYITIYAGLSSTSVKNGQTVKAGQTIGSIAPDPDNDSQNLLHFELRREREKLNPSAWVR